MLPKNVSGLVGRCTLASRVSTGSTWDALWAWGADETREKTLTKHAFITSEKGNFDCGLADIDTELAQATLKVAIDLY